VKQFVNGLVGLVVLAGACVGLALAAKWGLGWLFDGVDPTISAAIVAAAATTVVSVASVAFGRYFERQRQIEVEIRERKIPMYKDMVQGLLDGILNSKDSDNTAALEALFRLLTPQLVTWASDDVIGAWTRFKRQSGDGAPIDVMFQFEEVLKAVRIDLGHKSGDLAKGDLLGLFVNDIQDHLPSTK
jgi:hypothetical protein